MKKYSKKVITLLTFVVTMLVCSVSAFASQVTPTPVTANGTFSQSTILTFTNDRNVSVPTNASYPIYIFIAIAALSAVILFITIKQRRAAHD